MRHDILGIAKRALVRASIVGAVSLAGIVPAGARPAREPIDGHPGGPLGGDRRDSVVAAEIPVRMIARM